MRPIDADIIIKNLTGMKSYYDAITLDGMIKALQEAPTIKPEAEAMERIVERLEKLKEYEKDKDCPRDGMCSKKVHECRSCYTETAIEIVKEELGKETP